MILPIIFVILLIISSIYDLRTMCIPIWIASANLLMGILAVVWNFFNDKSSLSEYGLTILLTVIIILSCVLFRVLKAEAIGFGDGLVMLSINFVFGGEWTISIFCISFLLCGIVSGVLMVIKKANRKTRIPFIPFLASGTLVQLMLSYGRY